MSKNKTILHSLGHAVLVLAYVSSVALLIFNGEKFFGQFKNFTGPVLILLLFVLSATVVGTLVLGRPALLYLNGQKTEALKFFGWTVGWIFIIILIIFTLHFVK